MEAHIVDADIYVMIAIAGLRQKRLSLRNIDIRENKYKWTNAQTKAKM